MNATRKVKLKDITSNLTCNLCQGYFVDATTIIECLHSFCKSCIVKHLENNDYCPVCEVQLHSTKPLSSIRSDQMLQEIVFKLVPGLFSKEMTRRREFYEKHPECTSTCQMDSGRIFNQLYITSDDIIHISLEYFTEDIKFRESSKRYLKCPAAVSISILKKLIQGKYDLNGDAEIDIMYGERILPDDFLLMDIAYKYSWTNSESKPLQLSYRVKGLFPSVLSPTESSTPTKVPLSKRRSRTTLNSTVSRSEILKSPNRIVQVTSTTPKLTPNQKVKVKRKRNQINNNNNKTPSVESKRPKLIITKEMESQSDAPNNISNVVPPPLKLEKEVQLQISENGVISAKSVFSGEEKIIMSLEKTPPKNTPLVNKDELEKSSPTITESLNDTTATESIGVVLSKTTNYVKLNIPSITLASNNSNSSPITKINGSPSAKISNSPTHKLTPSKRKQSETASHKVSNGFVPNASSSSNFDSKQANVQKALMDLQKNYKSSKGTKLSASTGNSLNVVTTSDAKTGMNLNSIPSIQTHVNGTRIQNPFPFQLASLASSGMTVNIIPSTNTNTNNTEIGKKLAVNNSPPPSKKMAHHHHHHTTVVNGDLKFTSSPRHILPSPNKTVSSSQEFSSSCGEKPSPKKPPKFFKSRLSSSSISSTSSEKESPSKKEKAQSKKVVANHTTGSNGLNNNIAYANGNGLNSIFSTCLNGASTTTTPSGVTTTQSLGLKPSPQIQPLNALSQIMNLWNNPLQFNLSGGNPLINNMAATFVPYTYNGEYIPIPFSNSNARPLFAMNSIPNMTFPFAYQSLANSSFSQTNSSETATSHINKNGTTTQVSSSLSPRISASENSKSSQPTISSLDLSIKKDKTLQLHPLELKKSSNSFSSVTTLAPVAVSSSKSELSSKLITDNPLSLVLKNKSSVLSEKESSSSSKMNEKNSQVVQNSLPTNGSTSVVTIFSKEDTENEKKSLEKVNESSGKEKSNSEKALTPSNVESEKIKSPENTSFGTDTAHQKLPTELVESESKLENNCEQKLEESLTTSTTTTTTIASTVEECSNLQKNKDINASPINIIVSEEKNDDPNPIKEIKILPKSDDKVEGTIAVENQLNYKLTNGDHSITNGKMLENDDLLKTPITCNNNNNPPKDVNNIGQNLSTSGA